MVFESVVADLLNRFGGQYLENLDHSQLKIGIWGGDIVLKDLNLKPTILDEIDLPFRIAFGHIGKFVLKIPWTNIYNAPVIGTIEKVLVVIVPKTQIAYDAEKEEKQNQEAKQAALQQIEDAKKREREKDKPKEPDTFVEKLVTQIIKNVQLKISEIHVRYEDNFSQPQKPFSVGITLHDISVHSTDENWKKCLVPDAALKMIYKVLELKGLSLYWNCRTEFISHAQPDKMKLKLTESTTKHNPKNQYILAPINLITQLRLNPKPENDGTNYSTPKILLGLILQKLSLALSKSQYQDIIVLVDNIGAMSRASVFRKYRPKNPFHGHVKEWWKFAYVCVLESEVRRRRRNWNWKHMKEHRNLCRQYAKAYCAKLEARKVTPQITQEVDEFEKKLDVFNIVLVRQSVELEVERRSQEKSEGKGWFSGWFSSSTPKEKDPMSATAIMKKFEHAMTPEEKEKLYKAIDYQESSLPTQYPQTFVESVVDFELQGFSVEVLDDTYDVPRVLYGEISKTILHLEQRPSANAVKVVITVSSFGVWGLKQGTIVPHIVSFKTLNPGTKLLDVLFETNPLDGSCDQRLQISSRPLEIVYDAMSVLKLTDVFKTPQSQTMAQLQAAAESRLNDFKEVSAVGMQYAIEKHSIMDINIDLSASHIILPYSGLFEKEKDQDLLLVNLGHLSMVSMNQDRSNIATVKELYDQGHSEEEVMAFLVARSYDKFRIRLTDVQVLVALGGEDWEGTLGTPERCAMHLLEPTSLEVLLFKCLMSDDPRLPKVKVEAVLPAIAINVEDERVVHLLALLASVSSAGHNEDETKPELPETKLDTASITSSMTADLNRIMTEKSLDHRRHAQSRNKALRAKPTEEVVQSIDFQMDFIMKDLNIALFRRTHEHSESELLLEFKLLRIVFKLEQKTFDFIINFNMGSIEVNFYDIEKQIGMVSTPMTEGEDKYMFLLKFIQINKASPEFHSVHGSVVQLVEVDITSLTVLLHQEALLALWEYTRGLLDSINAIQSTPPAAKTSRVAPTASQKVANLPVIQEEGASKVHRSSATRRGRRQVTEAIDFKLLVKLFTFKVELLNRKQSHARFCLDGGSVDVIVKKSYTEVLIKLRNLSLYDPNPLSKHRHIMSVMGEEALSVQVVLFSREMMEVNSEAVDMSLAVKTCAIRVFYLNWFVSRIMNFINPFQMMQQMLEDAAKGAAESALQNVQDAYAKATRVSLNIDIQAPVIIIPVSSTGIDALYFDMGIVTIKNHFQFIPSVAEGDEVAVIDEIIIGLQDMKLLRVKLNAEEEVTSQCTLLQPISCKLLVRRNLSCAWYSTAPEIDCSGRLESVTLSLSEADYQMVLRIPSENMQEVELLEPEAEIKPSTTSSASFPRGQRPTTLEDAPSQYKQREPVPPKDAQSSMEPVTTKVKFTFTMDNLIVDLFLGNDEPETEVSEVVEKHEYGLARFSLNFISLKGHVFSDGTLSSSLLLVDCLLDDTRTDSKSKITRLMQRKNEVTPLERVQEAEPKEFAEELFKSMVDVTFQKKGLDTFVDVRVFGFDLVLSTEYLMKIGDFFAGWSYRESKDDGDLEMLGVTPSIKSSKVSTTKTVSSSKASHASVPPPPPPPDQSSMMTINIRVEKPDIIMVEAVDDVDARAIVLNKELTVKMRISDKHQVICGSIKDLELYSCLFNPKRRAESTYQILRPCCISIAGSTPGGEGLHLDVCLTPIRLSVSPAIIELLSNVQKGLVLPEPKKSVLRERTKDYSDLWQPKPFVEDQHWYFKREVAEEAKEELVVEEPVKVTTPGELCIVSVSSIVMTVEAGVGNQTLPMILVDMSFNGAVNNWSSGLFIDSCMSLEVKYYNSALALWEPLLEPVEVQHETGLVSHVPWELRLQMHVNPPENPAVTSPTSETDGEIEELHVDPPAVSIEISSKENLEITVTKTCLDVLSNLGKSFQTALKGTLRRVEPVAPFMVKNDTGLAIAVLLEKSPFKINSSDVASSNYREVMLESGARVELCLADPGNEDVWNLGMQRQLPGTPEAPQLEQYLKVKVIERNCTLSLPVRRADKRYFSLKHRGEGNEPWGLVSSVKVKDGGTIITLRSIIQVHNHFNVPIHVYYMTKRGNEVECIGTVEHKEKLNVPLYAVYTPTNELFFSVEGYTVSVIPFVWKNLQNLLSATKVLQCDPKSKNEDKEPFKMKIVGEMEQVFFENTARHTMLSTCYNLHLRPPIVFKNHLPVQIVVCLANTLIESKLGTGQRLQLPTAEAGKCSVIVRIPEYLEKEWSCDHEIESQPPEFSVWTFGAFDSMQKVSLDLGVRTVLEQGSTVMTIYCPYWMLNKTGLLLTYRKSRKSAQDTSGSPIKQVDDAANILYHPEHFKGPIMFSFKAKSFFGKKKASVKVEDSEWSDKFPLDVAGSSGLVSCKHPDVSYKIGVYIQLTYSSLTKQVVFTPYYVMLNSAKFPIEVQEAERPADPWTKVEPNSCTPLWPRCFNQKLLRVRVAGSPEMTAAFGYDKVYTTLLRLDNKYGGINVDVQITEGSVYIRFMAYEPGLAPALIMNNLDVPVSYHEHDDNITRYIEPKTGIMFTWSHPAGTRTLVWAHHKKKYISDDLRKDGIGEFMPAPNKNAYWVSFLDGMQRVILFTYDLDIARDAQSAGEMERIEQEITLSIHGVGLSLVNNHIGLECLYCCLASSGVIWEVCKHNHKRFKPCNIQETKLIEEAYVQYHQCLVLGETPEVELLENGMEVDFEKGELLKPNRRILRRTYNTGLWVQIKTSKHQMQFHAKINRLQVDNQMPDCLFPVVVAPVPLPRSISAKTAFKPFIEISVVKRLMEHSPVVQYKYFKALVQEFHIKVDIGFVNALMHYFEADVGDEDEQMRFEDDCKLVSEPLMARAALISSAEQKNFYDLLHFSPLKIHLSFSLSTSSGGLRGGVGGQDVPHFLNVLMQSLGVTLTDMQDVVFKLAYFDRQYVFLTQRQLVSEVSSHYVGQLLKQLYVLVLGLDVIGNPYGLVVGVARGVEDLFYEPFQGAIQGPGEFAEGLVLGVRSLFGHTVGGAAGAMSRIAGAMGKGVAALTFDKDYQRKRREQIVQRPANIQTGLAQSGKGLVMGVVAGVSGVFTKPVSGAKEEGVEGFFKGMGKGMVGLVTRPTAGIIDFASGTLDTVKRAADPSEEVSRLRPPRFMHPDGQVRPYVLYEAQGNKLLMELEKGRYSTTDVYSFHLGIVAGAKDVLLLTDKRVMYIVHNDVFGGWQVDWEYTWDSLAAPPAVVEKGIFITTKEPRKKVLGIFGAADKGGKIILVDDADQREWLAKKMNEIMKF